MAYAGTYETGKLVVYPIRKDLDEQGLGGLNDPIRQAAAIAQLAFSARAFSEFGITVPKWRVISRLGTCGSMRVGDIAKLTSIEGRILSRLLIELEATGLIKRKSLPSDSRVNRVSLTRSGNNLFERMMPYHDYVQQMSIDGLSPLEVATLRRALKRIYFNTLAADAAAENNDEEADSR